MTINKPIILFVAILFGLALQMTGVHAKSLKTAQFAGGCFWCVEADLEKLKGVVDVQSGYAGGHVKNPTYKQVTRGGTGHYEAVKVTFDADVISYRELVDIFWRTIDPTDAGGQFCDRGDSYRAAIFVTAEQKAAALASRAAAAKAMKGKIVTPILDAGRFYKAEDYHQNYYKGTGRVLTRFGYIKQSTAYKNYRTSCGRDKRVRQIWGDAAPFAGS